MAILYVSEMGFERRVTLGDGRTTIGRDEGNPVFLKHHEVSKKHAEISRDGERWKLRDLGSRNGTWVNSARVQDCLLADGDVIRIGTAALVFLEGPSASHFGKRPGTKRLGEMCAERGIIKEEELRKALEIQKQTKQKLGEVLIEQGMADPDAVMETLGAQLDVPWIDLNRYELNAKAVGLFPRERALQWCAIPVIHFEETRRLVVAMADVENLQTIEEMEFLTYCNIEPMLAKKADVEAAIEKHYGAGHALSAWAQQVREQRTVVRAQAAEAAEGDAKGVAKLVSGMVEEAVRMLASDIHVEPRRDKLLVRFRIDGILHEKKVLPKELQGALTNRIKILSCMDISEKRKPQDGHYRAEVLGREIDLRVATFPTIQGEKIVLRIHNRALAKADIESLGMPPDIREAFLQIIIKPEGLLVVTGPTGSGKTTTLYGALNHVKSSQKNLVTLEDPVELDLEGVNQGQVYDHPDFTFAAGLRAILRQDPNIILVGEVRDVETAQIAIQAALTGHLVLTTLHTNSAAGAIARLIDMGIEPYLITASLLGVQSQRLVRRICAKCKEPFRPAAELLRTCFEEREPAGATFYRGKGCAACPDGYSGRTGGFELLRCTEGLRRLIVAKASTMELRAKAREEGMITLREDALRRAAEGVTTLDEVVRVTYAEF